MSDFDGVGWDETKPEREGPNRETAPKGVHNAKIISAEKYKSKAGNWTVKVVFGPRRILRVVEPRCQR